MFPYSTYAHQWSKNVIGTPVLVGVSLVFRYWYLFLWYFGTGICFSGTPVLVFVSLVLRYWYLFSGTSTPVLLFVSLVFSYNFFTTASAWDLRRDDGDPSHFSYGHLSSYHT